MSDSDCPAAVLQTGSGPVSLWDLMIRFNVRLLVLRMAHLEEFENELHGYARPGQVPSHEAQFKSLGRPMWTSDAPEAILTQQGWQVLWGMIGPIQAEVSPLGVVATQIEIQDIANEANRWNRLRLADDLGALRRKIIHELDGRMFLFIEKEPADLLSSNAPFGDTVVRAFPSADYDIREAVRSYALERHTACVFHCMRVLEHGLRAMAEHLEKSFSTQNWYNVINEIEGEIRARANGKKTSSKDEEMRFLATAAKEFSYFKDGWRNHAMHGRSKYDGPGSLSVLNHTRDFMGHLATGLSEALSSDLSVEAEDDAQGRH